jgi:hypothetical protein
MIRCGTRKNRRREATAKGSQMSQDYDDILGADDRRVEERFRDLEQDAEIERMRREQGGSRRPAPASSGDQGPDPLADMKAAFRDDDAATPQREAQQAEADGADVERYVLALCPHCDAKNRVSLTKLRGGDPKCGACKQPLSFER